MIPRTATNVAVALCALSLTACASVYEGKYQFSEGWRKATVIDLVQGVSIERPHFWECTRKLEATQRAATGFVLLSYRGVNRQERRMVPAPTDLSLATGERVYLNLAGCDLSIAKTAAP